MSPKDQECHHQYVLENVSRSDHQQSVLGSSLSIRSGYSRYDMNTSGSHNTLSSRRRSRCEDRDLGSSVHDLVVHQAEVFSHNSPGSQSAREEEWKYVDPPDVGYAWAVFIFCLLLQLTSGVLVASTGIFLVEFIEEFQRGESTSWICTLQHSMIYIAGPLAGFLADRFSARTTMMLGCVGTGLSMAAASFTSSFEVMLVTYGLLAGSFSSCILIPSTVATASYFKKYKVVTLTLVTCFCPLIFMVASPLVMVLIDTYGWRIANLCVAALFVQATAYAALLTPQRLSKSYLNPGRLQKNSASHHSGSHYIFLAENSSVSLKDLHCNTVEGNTENKEPAARQLCPNETQVELKLEATPKEISEFLPLHVKASDPLTMEPLKCALLPRTEQAIGRKHKWSAYRLKQICHLISQSPLLHWRMAVLLLLNFLWGWGASTFYILLPDHAKYNQIDPSRIALLFTVIGAAGFGGRLSMVVLCRLCTQFSKAKGMLVAMVIQSGALLGLTTISGFEG